MCVRGVCVCVCVCAFVWCGVVCVCVVCVRSCGVVCVRVVCGHEQRRAACSWYEGGEFVCVFHVSYL